MASKVTGRCKRETGQVLGFPQESLHTRVVGKRQLGVSPSGGRQSRPGKREETQKVGARKQGQNPPPKRKPATEILERVRAMLDETNSKGQPAGRMGEVVSHESEKVCQDSR